jgi:hypothetical protein
MRPSHLFAIALTVFFALPAAAAPVGKRVQRWARVRSALTKQRLAPVKVNTRTKAPKVRRTRKLSSQLGKQGQQQQKRSSQTSDLMAMFHPAYWTGVTMSGFPMVSPQIAHLVGKSFVEASNAMMKGTSPNAAAAQVLGRVHGSRAKIMGRVHSRRANTMLRHLGGNL